MLSSCLTFRHLEAEVAFTSCLVFVTLYVVPHTVSEPIKILQGNDKGYNFVQSVDQDISKITEVELISLPSGIIS